ncbi:MAG: CocE/NonD family hydrolase [Ginsengibacter sp.]
MKNCFFFLSFFAGVFAASAQDFSENERWLHDNYYKLERMIPMRDGIKLFTAIYLPKDISQKHPVLLTRTPYSCTPYGENNFALQLTHLHYFKYLKEGYIFVYQDVRGRYMSEGDFVDVRPYIQNKNKPADIDESSDAYDAIEWLVKNLPANNGNVGVMGISYPGFYATMAALSNHPALKAVSPQAPVTDWFAGDDFHHNGALFLMDAFSFYSGFGKPRPYPTMKGSPGYSIPSNDNYDFYLRTGPLKNFSTLLGDSIKFWNDLMSHPDYDDWWKVRNPRNYVAIIRPATLVVGGLFDAEDCFGAWNLYKAIEEKGENENRIVEGPWFHGGWTRSEGTFLGNVRFEKQTSSYYQDSIEIPFFNYYLRGIGNPGNLSEATIFFSGENSWKHFTTWPPSNSIATNLFLLAQQRASFELKNQAVTGKSETIGEKIKTISEKIQNTFSPGKPSTNYSEYVSDPSRPVPYTEGVHLDRTREYMTDDQRFASRRPDVLVFETDALQNDLTVAGPVVADLFVSVSTTDADFVVKLIDVFPDRFMYDTSASKGNGQAYPMGGYQMLVRGEIMRGRYRNSLEKPEPFVPGKLTLVKYNLPDVAHTFKKGHKLMVQVQSSWFPLADRNPQKFTDIYHAGENDFQKATIRVYHDGESISKIILPVVK